MRALTGWPMHPKSADEGNRFLLPCGLIWTKTRDDSGTEPLSRRFAQAFGSATAAFRASTVGSGREEAGRRRSAGGGCRERGPRRWNEKAWG